VQGGKDSLRLHRMSVYRGTGPIGELRAAGVTADVEHGQGSRGVPERNGVDHHKRVVTAAEQLIGKMNTADAVIRRIDAGRQRSWIDSSGSLDTKAVVSQEDVANARDQRASGALISHDGSAGWISSGLK
jgi:hypothetical protein